MRRKTRIGAKREREKSEEKGKWKKVEWKRGKRNKGEIRKKIRVEITSSSREITGDLALSFQRTV